jgi:hypothetical protein
MGAYSFCFVLLLGTTGFKHTGVFDTTYHFVGEEAEVER